MMYVEKFPRCARQSVTSKYLLRKLTKRGSHFSYTEKSRAADLDFLYAKKSRGRTCTVDRNVDFGGDDPAEKRKIQRMNVALLCSKKVFMMIS